MTAASWSGRERSAAVLLLSLAATVGVGWSCTPAGALGRPSWRVLARAVPTVLVPGSPSKEVQELKVNASGGTFRLTVKPPGTQSQTTTAIPFGASAAEVQAAIAAAFGAEVVSVGGGGAGGPYVLTFAAQDGAPLVVVDSSALTGTGAAARVNEVQRGAPAGRIVVAATNVGDGAASGPIELSDVLPAGVHATAVAGFDAFGSGAGFKGEPLASGVPLACSPPLALRCTYVGRVDAGDTLFVTIAVSVDAAGTLPGAVEEALVSGGGAEGATAAIPVSSGLEGAPFGPAPDSAIVALSSTQAGAHPDVTSAFALSTDNRGIGNQVSADPKDVRFDLPAGLVGSTVGLPRCTMQRVDNLNERPFGCPADTMVGTAIVALTSTSVASESAYVVPVYDIEPAPGEPAAFAFNPTFPVRLDTSVLSDGDYAVRVSASELTEAAQPLATWVTIWGVPADHSGPGPDKSFYTAFYGGPSFGEPDPGQTRTALLTNPQQCGLPLSGTLSTDSWAQPGSFVTQQAPIGELTGCGLLPFGAAFTMLPDTLEAGAPAGYTLDLSVPQSSNPDGLATSTVKRVVTTLPLGTVISPSAAHGLASCSDDQFYGPASERGSQEPARPGDCPRASQVGTVTIKTPALAEPLTGRVFLGAPSCDPCSPADAAGGRMVRLFVNVVGEGEDGIVVKLEGKGYINQQTGQLTTVFDRNPQLPFSELKLSLGGGERASLANPRACGPATTSMDITPWSTPFTPDATPSSTFDVSEDCFAPKFSPSFSAGTTSNQAGGFSPFTLSFGRSDQDQFLAGIQMKLPPGLLGMVSSVPLCAEPQAAQGACPAASLIGHVNALTGPGADPFLVEGGRVFLTGPYKGAPYGLSIVVPATAGPYTLSGTTGTGTVVVRAAINVDPATSALTVTSDPLPTMLDGIPLQLKRVDVTVDRPGFTFNPTTCNPLQIAGALSSSEGLSAQVASHFQVTNCASLAFKPSFTASTSGHTSRAKGASLDVKLSFPADSQGKEANVARVKVSLPRQLPSQLKTLKEACPARLFDANPGACPAGSIVGVAKASTPVLPVQLTGPVYFVSHGGEAFPDLVIVLQGDGVRVDLTGSTFISKAGITSSTFRTVPDVPVSRFELYLPQGSHPALAANTNLCRVKGGLHMPTTFTAQDGAVIRQSTAITITGCPRAKASRARRARARAGGHSTKTAHRAERRAR